VDVEELQESSAENVCELDYLEAYKTCATISKTTCCSLLCVQIST